MIIRVKKNENYSVISNAGLRDMNLSARARGVYAFLMTCSDNWEINKTSLHKHFKEGRDAICKAFDELERAGYIERRIVRSEGGTFETVSFILHEHANSEKANSVASVVHTDKTKNQAVKKEEAGSAESTTDHWKSDSGKPVTGNPSLRSTKLINTNTPLPPKGDLFDAFWEAYPRARRKAKAAARNAFSKAIKKVSLDDMLKALDQHKLQEQWKKDGGQFIPMPSTWLNQERWEDELDAPKEPVQIGDTRIKSF